MQTSTLKESKETSAGAQSLPSTMEAAVFAEPGKIEVQEVAIPQPAEDEILVKLEGCGVCASNIPNYEGRDWFNYPMEAGAPGHEGWGVVVKTGRRVTKFKTGERVAMLSYKAYAAYDVAKEEAAMKLDDKLAGKPFPGEPLGCAINIFNRSDIESGQTVAIVGIGFLGALLTQLCKDRGAKVIAISRRDYSLEVAKSCGADHTVPLHDHWEIIKEVKKITSEELCDRVIECTGKEWPLNLSGELLKNRGKLIIAGFHQDGMRSVNIQQWNWKGLDVINAHEREQEKYMEGMREAAGAVAEGRMNPEPLYTHQFSLDETQKAFEHITQRPDGFLKALITFS
ncbi:MDR/zinc-dependent alcohol dehydrogenase-like family protein [Nafulsella turpanensis]|uniref:MDR/zinc-dependent alcohol dehydrogenase-like family protein n=1 Tax=Nafulsella turpanensis TaxID=1265690 RepID=UPI00034B1A8A|nr:zinc-binding dehydrogenase [Nafulsella turpanensis]